MRQVSVGQGRGQGSHPKQSQDEGRCPCMVTEHFHSIKHTQLCLLPPPPPLLAVLILTEVDQLTKDAQHALRRTMEKYTATCRLILCCNSTSKVIDPIRSRCLGVRVSAPTLDEVSIALTFEMLGFQIWPFCPTI